MLHITNGDSTVRIMEQARIAGDILPWRDVLHEGPTPAGLTLEEMSRVRARFIAASGWGAPGEVESGFRARDAKLLSFREHGEVVLWFEHDLYDQIQLLQLLAWFSEHAPGDTALSMICIDEYLGLISPQRMAMLYPQRAPVTSAQLQLGRDAWSAFCSPTPMPWERLIAADTSPLPYLAGALVRHLEQYPSLQNGANRTERSLLTVVAAGIGKPGRIFEAVQHTEERRFMGDSTFWSYLAAMTESRPPLLKLANGAAFRIPACYPYPQEFTEQDIRITEAGHKVLANKLDWVDINGIDKWLGGVHLHAGNLWRWDGKALVAPHARR